MPDFYTQSNDVALTVLLGTIQVVWSNSYFKLLRIHALV